MQHSWVFRSASLGTALTGVNNWTARHQEHPGPDPSHPAFTLRNKLETPHIPYYILALFSGPSSSSTSDATSLKTTLFWTLFTILLVLRCLSVFLGTLHFEDRPEVELFQPCFASSVSKGGWLMVVLDLLPWGFLPAAKYDGKKGTAPKAIEIETTSEVEKPKNDRPPCKCRRKPTKPRPRPRPRLRLR